MKKRFFAGVLACLMVVGLLPLSMWLKPVNAKAASTTKTYTFIPANEETDFVSGDKVGTNQYFTSYVNRDGKLENPGKKMAGEYLKLDGGGTATKRSIAFSVKGKSANVNIVWTATSDKRYLYLAGGESELSDYNTKKHTEKTATFTDLKAGDYYIYSNNSIYVYSVEVIETTEDASDTSKNSYEITVKDENAAKSSITEPCDEGTTFTLEAADETNFLYWVNSYGKIVSRKATYAFPVYYSDTYTAVYKSKETTYKFMTDYDQVYKTYTSSNLEIPEEPPVKYGREFDYWEIGETKVETVSNIKDAGTDTDVVIKPVYKEVTQEVEITVNNVTKAYKKNAVVTADATKLENFMYWYANGNEDKVLSFNDLYSFYADDKITSVTAKCGTGTTEKRGIITPITNNINGNSKTFVFEFTVPDGYTIEFAGVVASSTSSIPTLTDYEYVRGGSTNAKTFRYSWTKTDAAGTTWNVRPVLRCSDGKGGTTIILGDVESL